MRYALTAVPGVSEVATIGGFEKQYQVDLDPARLLAYRVPITAVMTAIQNANSDVGAMVVELTEREYMVRGLGYLKGLSDIENVVVGATQSGTPIRVAELGRVSVGPAVRRGIAELDGRGDAVGGIVIMRYGQNALTTIQHVKARLAEVQPGLPPGVIVRPVYDRSDLIERAIAALRDNLLEESLIVALVCLVFLLHARSALVAILTLPVGILMAFIALRWVGVGADIMSLGGIAIAIGAMIDAAIVMIENMHKHLERAVDAKLEAGGGAVAGASYDTRSPLGRGTLEHRGGGRQGGGAGVVLLAVDHHRIVHPGLHPGGPGGATLPPAGLHQDVRDGGGEPAGRVSRPGHHGPVHPRASLPGGRQPGQPRTHPGLPADHRGLCCATGGAS